MGANWQMRLNNPCSAELSWLADYTPR